jgi:hypothetical protein
VRLRACVVLCAVASALFFCLPALAEQNSSGKSGEISKAASTVSSCMAKLDAFYGFVAQGTVPSRRQNGPSQNVPIQEFGEARYWPDGSASLAIRVVINGSASTKKFKGTYSIDAQTCSGSVQWGDGDGPTWQFVVVSAGAELDTIDSRGDGTPGNPVGAVVFFQRRI